ncbi:hypothetical protein CC2G_006040 [Coprinopsis cinerea AmutBmut pab1-1]|nr:hypothetical protein CC2G_006040 [Coprinopsis cinerea AmutBmut pab1-1]
MLELFARSLRWARALGQSFFFQFGLHCATHQIRIVLISCIVITSLFYPALSLYSSPELKLSTIFDAFAPLYGNSALHAQEDLVNLWSGYDSLRTREDAVARAKCARALRVERIFIQSPLVGDDGALNQRILTSTLAFERRLNDLIKASDDSPCLKNPDGGCFVLSPLSFWNYDEDAVLSDDNIIDRLLSHSGNVTIAGISVSPNMVLAGRGSYEHHVGSSKFDYATFLAITYFFPDSDCLGNHEHARWVQMIEKAASQDAFVSIQIQEPTLIALDVDAVGKTSVTLSVKQRIAEGLSKAGTSNTLKVMSYNAILGVIAVFGTGAVRQFCAFAIVVLVAHWFLAHTFFMAVLSIDIARLELEELLRHDSSLAPSLAHSKDIKHSGSVSDKFQRFLKSRAAANGSLVMVHTASTILPYARLMSPSQLLAITATLYYATYTNTALPQAQIAQPLGAVSRAKTALPNFQPKQRPMAEHIWQVLNPDQRPLLHLRVEAPTILTLNPVITENPKTKEAKPYRTRRTINSAVWIMKIMLLPIGITTALLYGLLLYLLKDTELLETQRHGSGEEVAEEEKSLDSQISFSTLPRAIASDIELIASSKDGNVVVSVGLHNEIIIWKAETGTYLSIDAGDVLLSEPSTSDSTAAVTSLTVDDTGNLLAIGTSTGIITVWVVVGKSVTALPVLALDDGSAAVTELHFVSTQPTRSDRKLSIPPPTFPVILATYENGAAIRWSVERSPSATRFFPSRDVSVVRSSLLPVASDNSVLIAFSLDDGTIDLHETGDYSPVFLNDYCIQPGSPLDPVARVHACRAELNGAVRPIIAAATERGTVSLWDGLTGECISILDELQGRVNMLRTAPIPNNTCHFCGHPPPESISVAFSVDHVVRFFNLCINDQMRRCSCSHSQLRHIPTRDTSGRRSRSSSTASSRIGSPSIPRARLATAFEMADFPVSGHGVHSRRASEKEGRRSLDQLTVPFPSEEQDPRPPLNGSATPNQSQLWQNVVVIQVGDVTCERGGWDVCLSKYVGIRRKPRSQGKSKGGTTTPLVSLTPTQGLTKATLERWEVWTFDPATSRLRFSRLSDLSLKPIERRKRCSSAASTLSSRSSPPPSPSGDVIARLPFTRVAPLLISTSHALAGFGNTIGVFNFSSSDI